MQPPFGQRPEDGRVQPGLAGGMDPFGGGLFREAQLADAVGEHRRICGGQVEPALVHLGNMDEHLDGDPTLLPDERGGDPARAAA